MVHQPTLNLEDYLNGTTTISNINKKTTFYFIDHKQF